MEVGVIFDVIQISMTNFNIRIKQGSGVLLEKLFSLENWFIAWRRRKRPGLSKHSLSCLLRLSAEN